MDEMQRPIGVFDSGWWNQRTSGIGGIDAK